MTPYWDVRIWPIRGRTGFILLEESEAARVELVEQARGANRHGLLVCGSCGWSWLTTADADPDDLSETYVVCRDKGECVRRSGMRMRTFSPSARSVPGRFYDFSTGRRATPICGWDSIGPDGIIRGEKCDCHLPRKGDR